MSRRWLFVAALWLLSVETPSAYADPRRGDKAEKSEREPRKKQRRARKERRRPTAQPQERHELAETKPEAVKPDGVASPAASRATPDSAQKAAQEAAQGAGAEIVKEGDTTVKVMKFGGLDIEGRLKSPQLLYFVNRMHTEFDRPKLPHRSFMPELERSTEQEPLR